MATLHAAAAPRRRVESSQSSRNVMGTTARRHPHSGAAGISGRLP
jgi:hypothetical protein